MADQILLCDGTDPIYVPNWDNVVGDKTLYDGGYVGDLLTLTRIHLEEAKANGELREEDAGVAYGQAIMESMKNAIDFELQYPKSSLELCYLQAQIDKLICDCINETKIADSQVLLNDAQIDKLICDCTNNTAKTNSDILVNTAQIDKLVCDCTNDTAKTNSQILVDIAQIDKMICDCTNNTDKTASEIALNAAQENKLACDCCNASKETEAQIEHIYAQVDKLICDCCNDTTATNSKESVDRAQEVKMACDCNNETQLAAANADLIVKQTDGIEYAARQKVYDAQLMAWSIVFRDAALESVPGSIDNKSIDESHTAIVNYLNRT